MKTRGIERTRTNNKQTAFLKISPKESLSGAVSIQKSVASPRREIAQAVGFSSPPLGRL